MYWETKLRDFIDRVPGVDDTYGIFLMCSARPDPGNPQERCDYNTWGPVGPVRTDDPRYQSLFGSGVIQKTNQLLRYEILYALPPDGYIIYIEVATDDKDKLHDEFTENYLINEEDPPCGTRTFHELIRLMWEWTQVTYVPFSNDEVAAVTAAGILNRLKLDYGLSDQIIEEVVQLVPPMQVAKYISGEQNARSRPNVELIPVVPANLRAWAKSTCEPIPEPMIPLEDD